MARKKSEADSQSRDEGSNPTLSTAAGYQIVSIEVPIAEPEDGFCPTLFDVKLTKQQGRMLRRVLNGMAASGKKLTNGQPVKKDADVLPVLLDMLELLAASRSGD